MAVADGTPRPAPGLPKLPAGAGAGDGDGARAVLLGPAGTA